MFGSDFKQYYKNIFTLAIPIIAGNIAHVLVGAVDVFVASKHSVETLSAISIANSIVMCLFIIGIGLMTGITPVVSNYLGAKKSAKKYLLCSINYSLIIATIFFILTIGIIPVTDKLGFEVNLLPKIKEYLFIVAFSYFGAYVHFALKEFLQAFEIINFPNILSFIAVGLNLIFNYIFVFGFGIIPAFGAAGLAIATVLVRTLIALILLFYTLGIVNFKSNYKFDVQYIKQLLKVSVPIAIALLLEFCAFNGITIVMGRISGLFAASQSLLITITSMTFMVPLAISNVIAIKVGYANGARNYYDIKNYSFAGTSVTTIFMTCCAIILFIFPKAIINLFTSDVKLTDITIPLIRIAAIFQIFDGLQVSFSGILKGLKRTFFVTLSIIFGYWICGIPLGFVLAFVFNMQLAGFWYGFSVAIALMSLFMGIALFFLFKNIRTKYSDNKN